MKVDSLRRRLYASVRVDEVRAPLCIEYEWDMDLDCLRIWKITDRDTGNEVHITRINPEDHEDILYFLEGLGNGQNVGDRA